MTNENKNSEMDFELDYELPPKKSIGIFSIDTEAVNIEVSVPLQPTIIAKIPKREDIKHSADPLCSYVPSNKLITNITVWRWASKYTFYERFQNDAARFFNHKYEECDFIPFFSYIPQYIQLTYKQLNYYFWWRSNVRNKIYLVTDSSYILLYLYEIINLPDLIPPPEGIVLIYNIWEAYHETHLKLDKNIVEWFCDYCLINQLLPPFNIISPTMMKLITESSAFKEFFIKFDGTDSPYTASLLNMISNYNWRDSKYVTDDTYIIFEKHITGAFNYLIQKLAETDERFTFDANSKIIIHTKISRNAYEGSLCAYNIKRRIDIHYYSVTRSIDLRNLVTDAVKCAENGVRGLIGIKARLAVNYAGEKVKTFINEYFKQFQPIPKVKNKPLQIVPEYEKLYEAESTGLSLDKAIELENASWSTTNSLVDAFETTSPQKETEQIATIQFNESLVFKAIKILLLGDNNGFCRLARENNMLEDTLAESINENVYGIIGDIALEKDKDGNGYKIISDYKKDMEDYVNG